MQDLLELKKGVSGKALVQRAIRERIRRVTGARFDTPFFIRPATSARALWFVHLSRHPTARDVMIRLHWEFADTFEHFGPGGYDMLGWYFRAEYPLFEFGDHERTLVHEQLLESVPAEVHALAAETPVTVDTLRAVLANQTAARFSDLDRALLELYRGKEIEVSSAQGTRRGQSTTRLKPTDLIAVPQQRSLLPPRIGRKSSRR